MTAAYDLTGKRVWVAGHSGMVGSALVRRLQKVNCTLLTVSHRDLDLTRQREVEEWVAEQRPQAVFLAAAKVGGIVANDSAPVDFLYDNLEIATNVMHAAAATGVEKLLFLGSSCIYPKFAPQPIKEEALLTGPARAHQSVVRRRQDRRLEALPSLSPPTGLRLYLRDADQSLRTAR